MANISINILKKVDDINQEASGAIYNAMLEDLIERRKPQDPDLFRQCLAEEIPAGQLYRDTIQDFSKLAARAFKNYHDRRLQGTDETAETALVIPAHLAVDDELEPEVDVELEPSV